MIEYLKKLKEEEQGDIIVSVYLFVLLGVIILMYGLQLFSIAMDYQDVTYTAKSITKVIECDGAVSDRAYEQLEKLNRDFGLNMTFTVSDVNYFDNREKSIQFRDSFTVTVRDKAELVLANPSFGEPWVWEIPLVSNISGMSEVYWK